MNIILFIFIFVYNLIIVSLYSVTNNNLRISLQIGYTIIAVWIAGLIVLYFFIRTKAIILKTWFDKIGVIFASPIPWIIFIGISARRYEQKSTYEYNKDHHRYKIITYSFDNGQRKRIEMYKSADSVSADSSFQENYLWLKDSTWSYFSREGDTIKRINYSTDH